MSPEAEAYARVSLFVPLVLLGLLVYALVRRYRGRATPTWVKWLGAFVVGFGLSPVYVFLITEPLWVILPSLAVLWIAWQVGRSGRFRLAGLALLGLTLPGALWWGRFLLQDALDPFPLYDEALLLWWLPELVGVIMAAGLIVVGDRPDPVPRMMTRPPNAVRDPMALANVLGAAVAFGPYPLPSIVSELTAIAVTAGAATVATGLGAPWPLVLLGGALVFALIATELWYVAFPSEARVPWGAFAYVGHIEMERFRAATGTPVPNTARKMRAWLRDNEERPETRGWRAELLAVVGRLDEARAVAERIETTSPAEDYERDALLDYIDWISGEDLDIERRFRQVDAIGAPGSQERMFARGLATIALARDRAERGGDWRTPLAVFQREIGSAGWASFRQDTHRRRLTVTFLAGLVIAGVFIVPGLALQQLR